MFSLSAATLFAAAIRGLSRTSLSIRCSRLAGSRDLHRRTCKSKRDTWPFGGVETRGQCWGRERPGL